MRQKWENRSSCLIAVSLFATALVYGQQASTTDAKVSVTPPATPAETKSSGMPPPPSATRSSDEVGKGSPSAQTSQNNAVVQAGVASSNPTAAQLTPPASPQTVPSLTAKELLDANSQAVTHLASMFQMFGVLITIIVGVVGVLATWLGILAKKSVNEMVADWSKKLEAIKADMEAAKAKLQEAVAQAQSSANDANRQAQSITDAQTVFNKTLQDLDTIKAKLAALSVTPATTPAPATEAAVPPPPNGPAPSAVETVTAAESAEVANLLKGKLPEQTGGGPAA
jgi:F0F1-type ATP synthase membrane subunit b/b'